MKQSNPIQKSQKSKFNIIFELEKKYYSNYFIDRDSSKRSDSESESVNELFIKSNKTDHSTEVKFKYDELKDFIKDKNISNSNRKETSRRGSLKKENSSKKLTLLDLSVQKLQQKQQQKLKRLEEDKYISKK